MPRARLIAHEACVDFGWRCVVLRYAFLHRGVVVLRDVARKSTPWLRPSLGAPFAPQIYPWSDIRGSAPPLKALLRNRLTLGAPFVPQIYPWRGFHATNLPLDRGSWHLVARRAFQG